MKDEPLKRKSDSIITTPEMRKKAKLLSRCFINIMKMLTLCKCNKKKHKNVWLKHFYVFSVFFCVFAESRSAFFSARFNFFCNLIFMSGHDVEATRIDSRWDTSFFWPLESFFRVFATWANQWDLIVFGVCVSIICSFFYIEISILLRYNHFI